MLSDGEYQAVIDRFEDNLAVLLVSVEANSDEIRELVADQTQLPADGRHVNAVLDIRIEDDELSSVTYNPETTESRRQSAQDRFDRLSRRPPESDDE